jgi:hypothetical protein
MKPDAVAQAVICLAIAIVAQLPAHSRRRVSNLMRATMVDGLVDDADTIRILASVLDDEDHYAD